MDVEDGTNTFGVPVPEHERRRIAEKHLGEDDFYVPETDEDREKNTENASVTDLQEMRHRASQALRRTQGIYKVNTEQQSDWFVNKQPENMDLWPTSHPMAFEMQACLRPIINARDPRGMRIPVKIEEFQERMQERGAFMIRVAESEKSNCWTLVFNLDIRFYCEVVMYSPEGMPPRIAAILEDEAKKRQAEIEFHDSLIDKDVRTKIVSRRTDSLLREGEKTDEQSDEEAEEERLAEEEKNAILGKFRLSGIEAYVYDYRLHVIQ